jgi:hypothetical protein
VNDDYPLRTYSVIEVIILAVIPLWTQTNGEHYEQ